MINLCRTWDWMELNNESSLKNEEFTLQKIKKLLEEELSSYPISL